MNRQYIITARIRIEVFALRLGFQGKIEPLPGRFSEGPVPISFRLLNGPSGANMNFHEYQAKDLFSSYGIPVPRGIVARDPG